MIFDVLTAGARMQSYNIQKKRLTTLSQIVFPPPRKIGRGVSRALCFGHIQLCPRKMTPDEKRRKGGQGKVNIWRLFSFLRSWKRGGGGVGGRKKLFTAISFLSDTQDAKSVPWEQRNGEWAVVGGWGSDPNRECGLVNTLKKTLHIS